MHKAENMLNFAESINVQRIFALQARVTEK